MLGATIRIKFNEILSKLQEVMPVYAIMYSTGAVFLMLLVGIGIEVCRGRYDMLLVYLPIIALWGTVIIATPLVADLRYGYTMVVAFPAYVVMTLGVKRE